MKQRRSSWQPLALVVLLTLAISRSSTAPADDASSPTLYQHYTSGGVKGGLNASSVAFTLNGKPFTIFGGSFHYFRVVPQYWRQTLLRMKAAGLNSVTMYFPWNIHEPTQGHFDFTSEAVNIARFLEEVKLADMFAIVRIGPYTCGEWDLGGLPAWLLKNPTMKFRTNYKPFTDLVKIYLERLMAIVNRFQFTKSGGPVIMLQLENEYFGPAIPHSPEYLRFLHDLVVGSGFKELLFTSDPGFTAAKMPIKGIFPKNDVLETANFNTDSDTVLTALAKAQPGRPLFVSEFWPGWFDFWGEKEAHHRYTEGKFDHEMNDILFKHNASVNIYMFIGGTNFGFYNGANDKLSAFESALHVTTSYDYDAPLSESGNYTAKYHKTRELYQKLVSTSRLPKTRLPEVPKVQPVKAYGSVKVERQLPLEEMLKITKHFALKQAVPMEMLPEPQNFGFILYRVIGKGVHVFEVTEAIYDRSIFLEDGKEGSSIPYGSRFIEAKPGRKKTEVNTFDMLVENQGRINYGVHLESERKGINSNITFDDHVVQNVTAYSLDFNATFLAALSKLHWSTFNHTKLLFSPAMYEAKLKVEGRPEDTFLKMDSWTKGNVFVNGFNLGRYWKVGPTKTMYLPAPLLKTGENIIQVFELHTPGDQLHFVDQPILG